MSEDMKLPDGKTCEDCWSFRRCKMLFSCPPTNTECDWSPSRFYPKRVAERHVPPQKETRFFEAEAVSPPAGEVEQ